MKYSLIYGPFLHQNLKEQGSVAKQKNEKNCFARTFSKSGRRTRQRLLSPLLSIRKLSKRNLSLSNHPNLCEVPFQCYTEIWFIGKATSFAKLPLLRGCVCNQSLLTGLPAFARVAYECTILTRQNRSPPT